MREPELDTDRLYGRDGFNIKASCPSGSSRSLSAWTTLLQVYGSSGRLGR